MKYFEVDGIDIEFPSEVKAWEDFMHPKDPNFPKRERSTVTTRRGVRASALKSANFSYKEDDFEDEEENEEDYIPSKKQSKSLKRKKNYEEDREDDLELEEDSDDEFNIEISQPKSKKQKKQDKEMKKTSNKRKNDAIFEKEDGGYQRKKKKKPSKENYSKKDSKEKNSTKKNKTQQKKKEKKDISISKETNLIETIQIQETQKSEKITLVAQSSIITQITSNQQSSMESFKKNRDETEENASKKIDLNTKKKENIIIKETKDSKKENGKENTKLEESSKQANQEKIKSIDAKKSLNGDTKNLVQTSIIQYREIGNPQANKPTETKTKLLIPITSSTSIKRRIGLSKGNIPSLHKK